MKIAVCGSAALDTPASILALARRVGEGIAARGHTLLTGACTGLPHEAALGAHGSGGKVIGFSPAIDAAGHESIGQPTGAYGEYIYIPKDYEHRSSLITCYKYRNVSLVAAADAVIFLSGRIGTLNEYTIAYDLGRPIGVLLGTGGVADMLPELFEKVRKEPVPPIVFARDVEELLDGLEAAARERTKKH